MVKAFREYNEALSGVADRMNVATQASEQNMAAMTAFATANNTLRAVQLDQAGAAAKAASLQGTAISGPGANNPRYLSRRCGLSKRADFARGQGQSALGPGRGRKAKGRLETATSQQEETGRHLASTKGVFDRTYKGAEILRKKG